MKATRELVLEYLSGCDTQLDGMDDRALLACCDMAYSRYLMGLPAFGGEPEFSRFVNLVRAHGLAGARPGDKPALNVHLTAYVLGALNLAGAEHQPAVRDLILAQDWQWERIIASDVLLPRWPRKYSHHSWRVSHWIGGTASIVQSLWRTVPERCAALNMPTTMALLASCDSLIDGRSGLLRTYRSDFIQFVFRQLYRIRHDPDAGDVGGIVHLHWVNYAEGRLPYKSSEALAKKSWRLMQKAPFMESVPYCLDFDVVQIVRTADAELAGTVAVRDRAGRYAADILAFFQAGLDSGYALHKLPGALATIHECALIRGEEQPDGLDIPVVDIIKAAHWI